VEGKDSVVVSWGEGTGGEGGVLVYGVLDFGRDGELESLWWAILEFFECCIDFFKVV